MKNLKILIMKSLIYIKKNKIKNFVNQPEFELKIKWWNFGEN
jgi:hypothetical protein